MGQRCMALPYEGEKFIHVVRDPRIHHKPHKTILAHATIFTEDQQRGHEERLRHEFSISPEQALPHAFHNGNCTAGDVMKFAVTWQHQFLAQYRSWSARRGSDYFL